MHMPIKVELDLKPYNSNLYGADLVSVVMVIFVMMTENPGLYIRLNQSRIKLHATYTYSLPWKMYQ